VSDEAIRKAAYRWCAVVLEAATRNGVGAELSVEALAAVEKIIDAMKNAGAVPGTVIIPDPPPSGVPTA